jgi:hypothetical protein
MHELSVAPVIAKSDKNIDPMRIALTKEPHLISPWRMSLAPILKRQSYFCPPLPPSRSVRPLRFQKNRHRSCLGHRSPVPRPTVSPAISCKLERVMTRAVRLCAFQQLLRVWRLRLRHATLRALRTVARPQCHLVAIFRPIAANRRNARNSTGPRSLASA